MHWQLRHRRVDMQVDDALIVACLKGFGASQHLIQHHPEAIDVGSSFGRLPEGLLWRHVNRRAEHHAAVCGVAESRVEIFGDAEIGQRQRTVSTHHDVVGFQITMDDAGTMCRLESRSDLSHDPQYCVFCQRVAHQSGQAAARKILHRDVGAVVGKPLRINRHNVWMLDPLEQLVLVDEAFEYVSRRIRFQADHLERDRCAAFFRVRQIHRGHTSCGQPRVDDVATQFMAGVVGRSKSGTHFSRQNWQRR